MGAELVQGGDLSVRDSYLNMRTTEVGKELTYYIVELMMSILTHYLLGG